MSRLYRYNHEIFLMYGCRRKTNGFCITFHKKRLSFQFLTVLKERYRNINWQCGLNRLNHFLN